MRLFYVVLTFFCFNSALSSQKLVDYQFIQTIPVSTINFISSQINASYNVGLYKLTYLTSDASGVEHVASGLVCVPENTNISFPLGCYQHGTVAGRDDVPSTLMGGFQLVLAFSSHGYVVAAPDYVGLGDSPGIHPYVHAKTEASAGVDMLIAVREMADQLAEVSLNDQLFITGYSQGGHAAMALQKEIETNQTDLFTVTASAPMSGPYDVSGKMVEFTLADEPYATVAYLAWLTLGYLEAYPVLLEGMTLETVFKPAYIADIMEFANETIDLWTLNDRLTQTLITEVGVVVPNNMLLDTIKNALLNDPTHPLSMALADNNVYDWTPQVPTRMYYCQGDDQVTFENAILAEEVMNSNGAPDVTAIRMDTDAVPLTHGGCVIPASIDGIEWFDTFQKLVSSTVDPAFSASISIYAAGAQLYVNMEEQVDNSYVRIYNTAGSIQAEYPVSSTENRYDITELSEGFYLVQVISNNRLSQANKIVKY